MKLLIETDSASLVIAANTTNENIYRSPEVFLRVMLDIQTFNM